MYEKEHICVKLKERQKIEKKNFLIKKYEKYQQIKKRQKICII